MLDHAERFVEVFLLATPRSKALHNLVKHFEAVPFVHADRLLRRSHQEYIDTQLVRCLNAGLDKDTRYAMALMIRTDGKVVEL